MNTAWIGPPAMPVDVHVGLKGSELPTEGVAFGADVEHPEVVAVEHDHARARAEHRRSGLHQGAQRLAQPLALDAERHHGRFAARDDQCIQPLEIGRDADLTRLGAEAADDLGVRFEVALQGKDADELCHAGYQPRGERSCSVSSLELSRLTIG